MSFPKSPDSELELSTSLKFPTIPVYGTPANWLSQSQLINVKMASQYDDSSCDEATSSLGDSTYDFIDDRSTTTDDEERDHMAESASSDSLEADRPVAVSAPQYTPPHIQTGAPKAQLNQSPVSVKTPTYSAGSCDGYRPHEAAVRGGTVAEDPQEPIEFEEPSVINLNTSRFTEVSHILRTIEHPEQVTGELEELVKSLPLGQVNITVRQTMTSQSLDNKGKPYKALFVGGHTVKDSIVQKIATALAANAGSSTLESDDSYPTKFNIVPVSAFGNCGQPEVVLIDSCGLEMSVEDCTSATFHRYSNGKDAISLRMADGNRVDSWWSNEQYVYSEDWKLPDLAVFCMGDDESKASKETRAFARSFMNRHRVPSIVISKQATWDKQTDATTLATLDYLTPHLCLEFQGPHGHKSLFKKRYPIDLATFLNIDAGQLNRNLACLAVSKHLKEPRSNTQSKLRNYGPYYQVVEAIRGLSRQIFPEGITSIIPILVLGLLLSAPLMLWNSYGYTHYPAALGKLYPEVVVSSVSTQVVPTTTQLSLSSTSIAVATPAVSTPRQIPSSKGLSTNTDIASLLLDTHTLGPNKSDKFMVQILGDCHIIINPPSWYNKLKKAPTLLFRVSRQNTTVSHTISSLGQGVQALQIPHEEAYGILNVSVTTESKHVQQQSFGVDFGSSWLTVAAWKRASRAVTDTLKEDLSLVQTGLGSVYNQTKSELSIFVQQTKTKVADQRGAEHASLASHLKWGAQTKDLVLAQTKDLSKNLSHRFKTGQQQVSRQIQSLSDEITRSISIYTRERTHTISHQAHLLARTIKHLKTRGHSHRRDRLKTAQKKALRMWWKIVGVPKTSRLPKIHVQKKKKQQEKIFASYG